MNARQEGLPNQVRNVLLQNWDPIGIRGISRFDDEYDSYVPKVVDLLREGTDSYKLARHLLQIEKVTMGLRGNPERCDRVARALHSLVAD